jgi:Tol biopolymer transport system component
MSLAAGTRLGPYEILAPLGAGGMGEVYRARDSRLGRDVAVKVLPTELSSDPDVRARFEREAKTISSLNHPHICTLFDVGHEGETGYLVMELVEGETLAARLERGALAAEPLLKIAIEITDALDRAHRSGIVHRDLKPGNIMLTKSGAKLMDFGLARATGLAPSAGAMSHTPTMSRPLTAEGTIVGTFQYMAPEQLEGGEADARADLWALGCVLYEMATGKRAFAGKSQASLIGAIMNTEPAPMSTLSPLAPPALERIVRACLAKDPNDRIQTAHDVKLQLQWIAEGGSLAGIPAPVAARRRSREAAAWAIAAVTTVALAVLGALLVLRGPEPPRVSRFFVEAPEAIAGIDWPRLSPDGRQLAFLATDSTGTRQIWIRPIDALEAHPVGSKAPGRPFWSPDGRFLAYILDSKLRKVPVAGGPAVTMAETPGGADGSWGAGDVIVYDGSGGDSIRAVPAGGGSVKPATRLDRAAGESGHAWPCFLPDGRHFLFVATTKDGQRMKVGTLGSLKAVDLGPTEGRVEYTPPGYIVFPREGTLLAQRFDPRALKTVGEPVPVGEKVTMGQASGHFTLSGEGTLSYSTQASEEKSQLVWMDRSGRVLANACPPDDYQDLTLSPDGQRAVVAIVDPRSGRQDLWVRNLGRGVSSRITFGGGENCWPIWSPDGSRIAWASNRAGQYGIYLRLASGVGREDSLKHAPNADEGPWDWSRDGRWILTASQGPVNRWDIWAHPTTADPSPTVFLETSFSERSPRLSPDGRWIAYQSNESGRPEIYVQPFPGPGGKWQVSTSGGTMPQWRGDGKELFYLGADQSLMAVPVAAGETFESGNPVALFRARLTELSLGGCGWAVTADGQRFLLNSPVGGIGGARFAVVTNWTSELSKK